ncbi:MAG: hypothetical protein WBV55_08810 [Candidatus Sulfotelmatobacter sp.]
MTLKHRIAGRPLETELISRLPSTSPRRWMWLTQLASFTATTSPRIFFRGSAVRDDHWHVALRGESSGVIVKAILDAPRNSELLSQHRERWQVFD